MHMGPKIFTYDIIIMHKLSLSIYNLINILYIYLFGSLSVRPSISLSVFLGHLSDILSVRQPIYICSRYVGCKSSSIVLF